MSGDFWVEGMSVGVPEFDEAHKQFGQSIGRIIAALDQGAFETAAGICAAMAASAAQHGAAEEALLRGWGYPQLENVIAAQKEWREQVGRLRGLIGERSSEARAVAAGMIDAFVVYLLRGDINFKSFVQEMRALGRIP